MTLFFREISKQLGRTSSPSTPHRASSADQIPPRQLPLASPDMQRNFWQIDFNELSYDESDVIGSGRSAIVYKGTFRQQEVAIKILKETPDVDQLVEFQKELDVLSRIRTPNLVFFYGG